MTVQFHFSDKLFKIMRIIKIIGNKVPQYVASKTYESYMKCVENLGTVAFLCPLRLYWQSLHIAKSKIKGRVVAINYISIKFTVVYCESVNLIGHIIVFYLTIRL